MISLPTIAPAILALLAITCIAMPTKAASDNDAITISRSDFNKAPADILKIVERLENLALASTGTAQYARQYQRLQDALGKASPPVTKWEKKDRQRLDDLAKPDDSAWKALDEEKATSLRQQAAKTETALRAQEIANRRQAADQRASDAQERAQKQLDLQQAQIDLLEARRDSYYNRGYYNNNWWWTSGNIHGRPPAWRPDNRIYKPRPDPPQSYAPATQFPYSPARIPSKK